MGGETGGGAINEGNASFFLTVGKFVLSSSITANTGAPLSFVDLQPMTELGEEIRDWIYKGAMAPASPPSHSASASSAPPRQGGGTAKGSSQAADDLYDF